MSTHTDHIAHAQQHNTCFACASYCGQFTLLSAHCLAGGLDPEWTAAARDGQTAQIRAGVRWDNSCPRFAAAQALEQAA